MRESSLFSIVKLFFLPTECLTANYSRMKKGLLIGLFLFSCAYGTILKTKESKIRTKESQLPWNSRVHPLNITENNGTYSTAIKMPVDPENDTEPPRRTKESQLPWNSRVHPLNITENNGTYSTAIKMPVDPENDTEPPRRTKESQLPWNSTVHPLNITENNGTFSTTIKMPVDPENDTEPPRRKMPVDPENDTEPPRRTKESQLPWNSRVHPLNITENNGTYSTAIKMPVDPENDTEPPRRTKESQLPWNSTVHPLNITENNGTYSTAIKMPVDPENDTEPPRSLISRTVLLSDQFLNYTRNNDSFHLNQPTPSHLHQNGIKSNDTARGVNLNDIRMLAPPRSCILPTCALTNLESSLQYGDEKAGGLTRNPYGIGKK
ncbi:uncharacterized protein zgc:193726 isoform X3 [Anguilla anguilla]|uniref:uncharacterized protein zgc:193726 isoform X3 n=1 Tax=Anguilla anguilla TaxID=7936 RepID=UPI0015A983EF|nr:uncharacterized protein zgc:193726 isoform X3 [Anguilla anguilla]